MNKALIVVDIQNDFVDPNVLGNQECIDVIPKIKDKIMNGKYNTIIFTKDTHNKNYLETQEGKKLPVEHCIVGTDGWTIVKEINDAARKSTANRIMYVTKNTFGCADLPEEIKKFEIDEIEVVGVCTGICVISNVLLLKAHFPEMKISVDASCCACVTPESHKTAIEAMKMCQVDIIE